ncbi:hypothetical protein GCM10010259_66710 [Streptomyces daghestanicus]|uniref:Secreted protein n=1 Tax=Streptomyces daghestanicus TaxID=66885 RepID=A0ABQ3PWF9_9ACTN|nr:hypothetical protein GCM10010240_67580 [Streptomyces griseoviridis]GGU67182.1 hypothetical protein GCM10010259_66710 [Streptomyces daghestanicus]GHI29364.1 hypothetical protein Sdagh_10940 [Streptomyces daghestanicus]
MHEEFQGGSAALPAAPGLSSRLRPALVRLFLALAAVLSPLPFHCVALPRDAPSAVSVRAQDLRWAAGVHPFPRNLPEPGDAAAHG